MITKQEFQLRSADIYAIAQEKGTVIYAGSQLEITCVNLGPHSTNALTMTVSGLIRNSSGGLSVLEDSFTLPADDGTRRNVVTRRIPLTLGKLLSVSVACNSIVTQAFIAMCIRYSTTATSPIIKNLASGYAGNNIAVVYPSEAQANQYAANGIPTRVEETNPAAGAPFIHQVPFRNLWLVDCVRFRLVTAAGGGNRTPYVYRQGLMIHYYPATAVQAGGLTFDYMFHAQSGAATLTIPTNITQHHLSRITIPSEDSFGIGVDGIQVTDQLSLIDWQGYVMQCDS